MSTQETAYQSLQGPLYSAGQVLLASLIGGPVGGALLLRANYRALNDSGAGTKALIYATAATVLLLIVAQLLPSSFPNSAIPAFYAAAMYQVHVRYQGGAYKAHISAGGHQHSWVRAIALGVVGLVGLLAVVFAVVMALP